MNFVALPLGGTVESWQPIALRPSS